MSALEKEGDAPALSERVDAQRQQIWKAMSIVECCKLASASLYEIGKAENMVPAFEAIYDLLGGVSGELEDISEAVEESTRRSKRPKGRTKPRSKSH